MSTVDEPADEPAPDPSAGPAGPDATGPGGLTEQAPPTIESDAAEACGADSGGPPGRVPSATVAPRIGRAGSYSKGIARRQEILDRAIEVFRQRGADGTSLRRIAQAIGVSHGALLHYFSSREELLVAVYEHAEYRRDGEGKRPQDVRSVDVMVNAAIANLEVPGLVQLYSTLVATSLEEEAGPAKDFFTTRFERVRTDLEQQLHADQAAGLVRSDVDPARMAALIVAASDGLQIQWLLEPSIELQETLETFAVLLAP